MSEENGTREVLVERSRDTRGYQIRVEGETQGNYALAYRVFAVPAGRKKVEIHKLVLPRTNGKSFIRELFPRHQKIEEAIGIREANSKMIELVRARAKNYQGVNGFRLIDKTGDRILEYSRKE